MFRCAIDETHKISTLFGWVNVPSAAWIDEEGRIVRINEGAYAGEHHIDKVVVSIKFGSTAFADATRDWVEKGADSEYTWSADEVRAHLKPSSESTLLADPTFKLGVYFKRHGKEAKAQEYFTEAQRLSPGNWNYHRQDWTHKGQIFALRKWYEKATAPGAGRYYDKLDLAGLAEPGATRMSFLWTSAARKIRGLFGLGRS